MRILQVIPASDRDIACYGNSFTREDEKELFNTDIEIPIVCWALVSATVGATNSTKVVGMIASKNKGGIVSAEDYTVSPSYKNPHQSPLCTFNRYGRGEPETIYVSSE
jgi:hypothetical protein